MTKSNSIALVAVPLAFIGGVLAARKVKSFASELFAACDTRGVRAPGHHLMYPGGLVRHLLKNGYQWSFTLHGVRGTLYRGFGRAFIVEWDNRRNRLSIEKVSGKLAFGKPQVERLVAQRFSTELEAEFKTFFGQMRGKLLTPVTLN